jgi:hypothetical protein
MAEEESGPTQESQKPTQGGETRSFFDEKKGPKITASDLQTPLHLEDWEKSKEYLKISEPPPPQERPDYLKALRDVDWILSEPSLEKYHDIARSIRESEEFQREVSNELSARFVQIWEKMGTFMESSEGKEVIEDLKNKAAETKPDLGATKPKTEPPTSTTPQDNQAK